MIRRRKRRIHCFGNSRGSGFQNRYTTIYAQVDKALNFAGGPAHDQRIYFRGVADAKMLYNTVLSGMTGLRADMARLSDSGAANIRPYPDFRPHCRLVRFSQNICIRHRHRTNAFDF